MLLTIWLALKLDVILGAGVFGKQMKCENMVCYPILSGLITLTNDEAFEYTAFNLRDVEIPSRTTQDELAAAFNDTKLSIRIEKSPLLIIYDLVKLSTVYGGFSENSYSYTWAQSPANSIFDFPDFDADRCTQIEGYTNVNWPIDPDTEALLRGGRVCGCETTGYFRGRYTDVERSDITCNVWSAKFRPSESTWASRHCPMIHLPIYNVYRLRSWRWEFSIKLDLVWYNENERKQRNYTLNWASPEVYDNKFDFQLRLLFSVPQTGNMPPDIGINHYVLIPENATNANYTRTPDTYFNRMTWEERALDSLGPKSLLLPRDKLDIEGVDCRKVGTSLFAWARETYAQRHHWHGNAAFCNEESGNCVPQQPNDLLAADYDRIARNESAKYMLSEQALEQWSFQSPYILSTTDVFQADNSTNRNSTNETLYPRMLVWPTSQTHTTQLQLILNATEIAWFPSVSQGEIRDLVAEERKHTNINDVHALVFNNGNNDAMFTLQMPACEICNETYNVGILKNGTRSNETLTMPPDEASPRILSFPPVARKLAPNAFNFMEMMVERPSGWGLVYYNCSVSLLSSNGAMQDTRNVTLSFSQRPRPWMTHDTPVIAAAKIYNYKINPYNMDVNVYAKPPDEDTFRIWDYFKDEDCKCRFTQFYCLWLLRRSCWMGVCLTIGSIIALIVAALVFPFVLVLGLGRTIQMKFWPAIIGLGTLIIFLVNQISQLCLWSIRVIIREDKQKREGNVVQAQAQHEFNYPPEWVPARQFEDTPVTSAITPGHKVLYNVPIQMPMNYMFQNGPTPMNRFFPTPMQQDCMAPDMFYNQFAKDQMSSNHNEVQNALKRMNEHVSALMQDYNNATNQEEENIGDLGHNTRRNRFGRDGQTPTRRMRDPPVHDEDSNSSNNITESD